eukprot:symbB.v1.2.011055.t1/scaffold728.1/size168468/3
MCTDGYCPLLGLAIGHAGCEYFLVCDATFVGTSHASLQSGGPRFRHTKAMHCDGQSEDGLSRALEDLLAGKSEEELGLSPPRLNAFLLLIHLDHAVRQGKTCLSKIFNAENKGPRKQLEVTQFYRGLKRIHVIEALELSEEALCEALYELDPGFDGRVYLPVLDRALKILASTGVYSRKPPHVEEEYGPLAYGETSPVRSIDIPMEADSINNFRKAFKCFRDQQNALLTFHSNLKHLGDEEHNRMSAAAADQ